MKSNTLNVKLLYALLSIAWLGACRKDEVQFSPYEPSVEAIGEFLRQTAATNAISTFDLRGGGALIPDTTLTTTRGTRVFLVDTDQLFNTEAGTPQACSTCGTVRVEITEVPDRSDLLSRSIATRSNGALLQCGAVVRVRVTCDGNPLKLRDDRYLKIQVPAPAQVAGMGIYYATPDATNRVDDWQVGENNSVFWADWQANGALHMGYEMLSNRLDWVAAQQPVSVSVGSSFCAVLPPQFDGDNTTAFLVLEGTRCVVPMQAGADGRFCADGVPQGYEARVVSISKAGPNFWLGTFSTETGTDLQIQMAPQTSTTDAITTYIQAL
jgi:hypothetical protein